MKESFIKRWFFFLISALGLLGIGLWNRELFHFIVEFFGVFVGMLIFIIAVNSKLHLQKIMLLTIGIAYVYVSVFDFMHMITFRGMPFFEYDINQSVQYWLNARITEAMSFLIILNLLYKNKSVNYLKTHIFLSVYTISFFVLISNKLLPKIYIDGEPVLYKYVIESGIVIVFLISVYVASKLNISSSKKKFIITALLLKASSELIIGFFDHSFSILELIAHILKYLSFGGIYILFVNESIKNPYSNALKLFKSKHDELQYLADIDQLTNIYNHTKTFDEIQKMIDSQKKYSDIAVVLIDVDNFKIVNDTYGHLVGDEVLIAFSKMLRSCEVPNKIVGRYGGDEFAMALPNVRKDEIEDWFDRLRLKLDELVKELNIYFTFSAGVAFYQPGDTTKDLIYKADIKMYEAKRQGKNRFVI